jgi:hypothetical protein
MIQICDLIIILINFVNVQAPNKQLLTTDEERLNKRLATTPTERFRLMINLFKLNQKLKRANQPQ